MKMNTGFVYGLIAGLCVASAVYLIYVWITDFNREHRVVFRPLVRVYNCKEVATDPTLSLQEIPQECNSFLPTPTVTPTPTPSLSPPLRKARGGVVKPVEATDNIRPIDYIRQRGQELGIDDPTISKLIRVARCESGFNLNPKAKNPHSTASGVFQITHSTWVSNKCDGDIFNAYDNTDCAYVIYLKRGFFPWNSSIKCWNG